MVNPYRGGIGMPTGGAGFGTPLKRVSPTVGSEFSFESTNPHSAEKSGSSMLRFAVRKLMPMSVTGRLSPLYCAA